MKDNIIIRLERENEYHEVETLPYQIFYLMVFIFSFQSNDNVFFHFHFLHFFFTHNTFLVFQYKKATILNQTL